jgi:RNA polymerase sigma factor (sigma-70 family)
LDSFEAIHQQYEKMIHSVIHSLHIYKNQSDFYQTGLIALWEAYENFQPDKGPFAPYAYSFIKGRMMTALTSEHRVEERNTYPKEEFWELIEEGNPSEMLPKEVVLSYCETLTKNERKWVLFTSLEMMTIREIAEKENVTASAVKKWRKGAKEKLSEAARREYHASKD